MAIAFDAVSSGNQTGGTTLTIAHTCTGSGVTLVAYFASTKGVNTNDVTATYNGTSMTKVASQLVISNIVVTAQFVLYIGTGDGTPHNVVFTSATSPDGMTGGVQSFTGTHATQNGANGSATASSTSSGVTLTTTTDNSVIVAGVFINDSQVGANYTVTGTTINKWALERGGFGQTGGYATTTTAGSNSIGWTNSNNAWGSSAVEIIAGASAVFVPPARHIYHR